MQMYWATRLSSFAVRFFISHPVYANKVNVWATKSSRCKNMAKLTPESKQAGFIWFHSQDFFVF